MQAEDEIAAIGIAVGAGWNGARAFTTTSGPGISLMQEFFGLAYFAEIPVVVFDVQRGGPSTGMPTRTQQSDLLSCAFASHGDTKHVLLMPDGPGEAFEFTASAFDFAERLQTAVFVMLDLDIGMNSHSAPPFRWDDSRALRSRQGPLARRTREGAEFRPLRRRRRRRDSLSHASRRASDARRLFHPRHQPRPLRPLHRGRPPYVDNMERLVRKFETARGLLPRPVLRRAAKPTRVGVIYYGSTSAAMDEAVELLADEGLHVDALRIRAFPLRAEIADSSTPMNRSSSSSKTATRRCAR